MLRAPIQSIATRLSYLRQIATHPLNSGHRASAVLRYLAWNIGRRLVTVEFVIPLLEGAKLILSNHENYATLAYTETLWDFSEMMFLLHFLREEDLFVDIGANVGCYTVLASALGQAHSVAIEPVPATFQKLRENIRLNAIESRVEAMNVGIGQIPSKLEFTTTLGGLNRVARRNDTDTTVAVDVYPLDKVLAGKNPVIMKLDVEGYEMNVLRGGARVLAHNSLHALIIELNGSGRAYGFDDAEIHRHILSYGFRPFAYNPIKRSLSELSNYRKDGLNTLYCRRDIDVLNRITTSRKFAIRGRLY